MNYSEMMENVFVRLPYRITDRVLFGSHRGAPPLQVLVQHLIRGPRPGSFSLDGHTFHCQTSHKYFFEREHFEQDLWEILRERLGPNDVVYDVGAHFGFWAVRLSGICREVIAFEPSPINLATLRRNAGSIANVTLINAAAGSAEGVMSFSEGGSMSKVGVGETRVNVTTIDASAENHASPTFLLIDVEGFAGEVLRGASKALTSRLPMILEIHDQSERDAVNAILTETGYEIHSIDNDHRFPFRIFAAASRRKQSAA